MNNRVGAEIEKIRVFLVDDHPMVREGVRRLLETDEEILVVGEADNAEDVFVRVAKTSAQVVLMDINLPGVNGIEATRRLMTLDPDLRVVILSSFGDQYLAPAIEAGACGYVLKTATQMELAHAVVQAACGQSPIDPSLTKGLFDRFAKMAKASKDHGLSGRQTQILEMVATGSSSKKMETELFISAATLKREFRNIFDLLGVNDRAQAVAEAYKRQLI